MDGFFSRFAWAWLDRQSSDYPALTMNTPTTAPRVPAKKSWSKHAAHQRTLKPHHVSSMGHDGEVGPPPAP